MMERFEQLRKDLHDALLHLHAPDLRLSAPLCAALGCDAGQGSGAAHAALSQLIETLVAAADAPEGGRTRRGYSVLRYRFVLGFTQEQTAEHLDMSVRSVQRLQREATHLLAARLWQHLQRRSAGTAASAGADDLLQAGPQMEWLSQVRQEVLALQESTPETGCDLARAIEGALRLARAASPALDVEIRPPPPGLHVRAHPSALRQILLSVIEALQHALPAGQLALSVNCQEDQVLVEFAGRPALEGCTVDVALPRELLAAQGGSITSWSREGAANIMVRLPRAGSAARAIRVLVVDDNVDLVTLYASYCAGTSYELSHVREGRQVLQAIENIAPDIIMLDVMLPDVDGWDLLLDLHANPATRPIPIIVCSVITDEQLALNLGAALYLRKPVWRQQMLDAYRQVLVGRSGTRDGSYDAFGTAGMGAHGIGT